MMSNWEVKVGVVKKVLLDDDFFALVEFEVDSKVKIPSNSSISVFSDGLLGNKYLSIAPGGSLVNKTIFYQNLVKLRKLSIMNLLKIKSAR